MIGMREIHSIVLDRGRTSEGVDQQFADRQMRFRKNIRALSVKYTASSGRGVDPRITTDPTYCFPLDGMALRCSCVPLMPISIIDITSKQELVYRSSTCSKSSTKSKFLAFQRHKGFPITTILRNGRNSGPRSEVGR